MTIGFTFLGTMILGAVALAIMPSTASAKDAIYNSEFVRHHDLDLSRQKDVAKLHHRVSRAAKNVCAVPGIAADILRRDINDCVDETRAKTLQNLEQRLLTSAVDARRNN